MTGTRADRTAVMVLAATAVACVAAATWGVGGPGGAAPNRAPATMIKAIAPTLIEPRKSWNPPPKRTLRQFRAVTARTLAAARGCAQASVKPSCPIGRKSSGVLIA